VLAQHQRVKPGIPSNHSERIVSSDKVKSLSSLPKVNKYLKMFYPPRSSDLTPVPPSLNSADRLPAGLLADLLLALRSQGAPQPARPASPSNTAGQQGTDLALLPFMPVALLPTSCARLAFLRPADDSNSTRADLADLLAQAAELS
jgi:hypothetical protein